MGERALWLNLSRLTEKEKADFLDAPIEPKELFGPTVATMRQSVELHRAKGEAFDPDPVPTQLPQSKSNFHNPRVQVKLRFFIF